MILKRASSDSLPTVQRVNFGKDLIALLLSAHNA